MISDRFGREVLQPPPDFLFAVRRGDFPGLSIFAIRGKNPDVDTGANEDIIPWGGLYAFQSAAVACEVVSTSAADAAAGTGLRTARVVGLDDTFAEITEDVMLNGVTPVALVNSYRRINAFVGLTAGSGTVNAGTVSLRVTAGAIIQAQMPPGESNSRHGVYTVAAGKRVYAVQATIDIRKSTADDIEIMYMARKLSPLITDGAAVALVDASVQGQGTSTFFWPLTYGGVDGPTDILIRGVNAGANNIGVVANIAIILEEL